MDLGGAPREVDTLGAEKPSRKTIDHQHLLQ